MEERRRINFEGRVQGVGFRATARGVAVSRDVRGWVRNEPDGSVSCEVQGDRAAIESFLAGLRGAMLGKIEREQATPIPVVVGEAGFVIRA